MQHAGIFNGESTWLCKCLCIICVAAHRIHCRYGLCALPLVPGGQCGPQKATEGIGCMGSAPSSGSRIRGSWCSGVKCGHSYCVVCELR